MSRNLASYAAIEDNVVLDSRPPTVISIVKEHLAMNRTTSANIQCRSSRAKRYKLKTLEKALREVLCGERVNLFSKL